MISRFCNAVSGGMEDALRRLGFSDDEVVNMVGSACKFYWDEMGDDAKAIYRDLAEQDRVRYQNELAAYQQLIGNDEL